jgi:hypothetical protein
MKCLTGLQSTSAPYWLMTTGETPPAADAPRGEPLYNAAPLRLCPRERRAGADHNGADLAAVTNLLAPLSLAVDSVHDLSNQGVGAARARVASRRARGKVLVRVAP